MTPSLHRTNVEKLVSYAKHVVWCKLLIHELCSHSRTHIRPSSDNHLLRNSLIGPIQYTQANRNPVCIHRVTVT